jgi:ribosome-associated protein
MHPIIQTGIKLVSLYLMIDVTEDNLLKEVEIKTSRSGGKGGQNVNKVSSKVEMKFDLLSSALFDNDTKSYLLSRLANRLSSDNCIRVVSQEERSQYLNKQNALTKLHAILVKALQKDKPRKASKPKAAAIEKRLRDKQRKAEKKILRRNDFT